MKKNQNPDETNITITPIIIFNIKSIFDIPIHSPIKIDMAVITINFKTNCQPFASDFIDAWNQPIYSLLIF